MNIYLGKAWSIPQVDISSGNLPASDSLLAL
jgi:hypothetical protein